MRSARVPAVQVVRQRALASVDLDGPYAVEPGAEFAVCTLCGAVVMLGDRAEGVEPFERGVELHAAWHRSQRTDLVVRQRRP